ncbi:putative ABC-transporter TycD [Dictyoglomus turgidum DSM 6724]|jgi:hypothetical protein|uniref:ABC-transporter TycD n=1 Tax=Dictyoglomus turgidum (strain DSM 6724 / Z-1310) TaxID=515635 RepID=B8E351_DICTD|nr:putative ABC-transporter TycD [Dictyoglomus turgidum DSM 6724]PNV80445.1 MAG: hypothetical protein C0196_02415 [Dictyoglomus turgidum]HBU30989.1 hypothetical protein [Dictyoglomus sp.]
MKKGLMREIFKKDWTLNVLALLLSTVVAFINIYFKNMETDLKRFSLLFY